MLWHTHRLDNFYQQASTPLYHYHKTIVLLEKTISLKHTLREESISIMREPIGAITYRRHFTGMLGKYATNGKVITKV